MYLYTHICIGMLLNIHEWMIYLFVSLCVMPCHTKVFAHRTLPRRGLAITGGGSLQLIHYMVMLTLWRMPMLFRFFLWHICFRDWFLVFSAAAELMLKGWWVFTGLIGINHNKVGQHIYIYKDACCCVDVLMSIPFQSGNFKDSLSPLRSFVSWQRPEILTPCHGLGGARMVNQCSVFLLFI